MIVTEPSVVPDCFNSINNVNSVNNANGVINASEIWHGLEASARSVLYFINFIKQVSGLLSLGFLIFLDIFLGVFFSAWISVTPQLSHKYQICPFFFGSIYSQIILFSTNDTCRAQIHIYTIFNCCYISFVFVHPTQI